MYSELVHNGASILTRYLYPNIFPVVLQLMWFAIGSTVILYFWGLYEQGSFCCCAHFKHGGCILNVVTWLNLLVFELVYTCVYRLFSL